MAVDMLESHRYTQIFGPPIIIISRDELRAGIDEK